MLSCLAESNFVSQIGGKSLTLFFVANNVRSFFKEGNLF